MNQESSDETGLRKDAPETPKTLSDPPPAKHYEQLLGKTGRHALYRPDRFSLRDLVDDPTVFKFEANGHPVRPRNFSLAGFSFRAKRGADYTLEEIVEFRAYLETEVALATEGRVVRVERTPKGLEVGVACQNGLFDYEALSRAEREHRWREALRVPPQLLSSAVPEAYRRALLDLGAFCQFHKNLLSRRELETGADPTDIAKEAFSAMQDGWMALSAEAARVAVPLLQEPEALREAQRITEALVTPYLVEAPVLSRAYEKPLGYPGDYVVMQHYFDNAFRGDTAFGKVFHKITNEHPLSSGVRTRAQHVADIIRERALATNGGGPLKVLSLGCGIGAEVSMVHRTEGCAALPIQWTLIDQEDAALAVAYRQGRLSNQSGSADAGPSVHCLNVSFSQLFSGQIPIDVWGAQDVIFAMGLFDYVTQPGASMLVAGLYSLLRPGGIVVIGNASWPNTHFWEPGLALRWSLLYRTKEEMEGLGGALPSSATVEVGSEPLGAYYIFSCQKN